jgi:hypothetical protein
MKVILKNDPIKPKPKRKLNSMLESKISGENENENGSPVRSTTG